MTLFPEHTIVLSPVGEHDDGIFKPIIREVQRIFGFPVEKIPLLPDLNFALDPKRNQYYSTVILEKLAELAPPQSVKVLAVACVDLFIPILTYVYGEAQLGGKTCIISTFRLNEEIALSEADKTIRIRVVKEAIHELGHTFKLRHCPDPFCIMHYCRTIGDVDNKSDQLCRHCKILLDDERKRLANAL